MSKTVEPEQSTASRMPVMALHEDAQSICCQMDDNASICSVRRLCVHALLVDCDMMWHEPNRAYLGREGAVGKLAKPFLARRGVSMGSRGVSAMLG
eukprot:scaffold96110_cov20-Prasinocladus_malaysianus.AAC.1